jgi:xylose isomerase
MQTEPMNQHQARSYFADIPAVRYEGPESRNPLAFRHYDAARIVLGRPMAEQLRLAACYWHGFAWTGQDPFGGDTFERPWFERPGADPMEQARLKAAAAFELFDKLGVPFYCFHDRDVAPEGATPRESKRNLWAMADVLQEHMERTGVRLLWGTANLFSHRRYMAGAASNPDPEVFAHAAAQVREALDVTHRLGGRNYVLWGGREGYETLLNTDVRRELDQMGRFLALVVEHKHRLGFKGQILVEPKPREPSKHQYDFDTATVYGFLRRYDLQDEVRVNIEVNHATLAGHSFEHEVALALALGIFGSVDMNRGDPQCGWDTDQFPNSAADLAHAFCLIFGAGGFTSGGMNFDAKVRRQSLDPEDLVIAHIGGMDTCARALLAAEALLQDGGLRRAVEQRYAGWSGELGTEILAGRVDLQGLADRVLDRNQDVRPVSGKQELLENHFNRFV